MCSTLVVVLSSCQRFRKLTQMTHHNPSAYINLILSLGNMYLKGLPALLLVWDMISSWRLAKPCERKLMNSWFLSEHTWDIRENWSKWKVISIQKQLEGHNKIFEKLRFDKQMAVKWHYQFLTILLQPWWFEFDRSLTSPRCKRSTRRW
jgi:hypothetical protein